jgi:hypothetical protein
MPLQTAVRARELRPHEETHFPRTGCDCKAPLPSPYMLRGEGMSDSVERIERRLDSHAYLPLTGTEREQIETAERILEAELTGIYGNLADALAIEYRIKRADGKASEQIAQQNGDDA